MKSGENTSPIFWLSRAPASDALLFFGRIGQLPVARLVLPLLLARRLANPFAARAGAVFLAEGGFGVGVKPVLAATAFSFTAMLFHAPSLNEECGRRLKFYSPPRDWRSAIRTGSLQRDIGPSPHESPRLTHQMARKSEVTSQHK